MGLNYLYLSHAGINNARDAKKLENTCFRYKKDTWYVEWHYILQAPRKLNVIVNRFRYINNNVIKNMCYTSMDKKL